MSLETSRKLSASVRTSAHDARASTRNASSARARMPARRSTRDDDARDAVERESKHLRNITVSRRGLNFNSHRSARRAARAWESHARDGYFTPTPRRGDAANGRAFATPNDDASRAKLPIKKDDSNETARVVAVGRPRIDVERRHGRIEHRAQRVGDARADDARADADS